MYEREYTMHTTFDPTSHTPNGVARKVHTFYPPNFAHTQTLWILENG